MQVFPCAHFHPDLDSARAGTWANGTEDALPGLRIGFLPFTAFTRTGYAVGFL